MLTAVDLFAGGGGFSTGARSAGVKVLAAYDNSEFALKYHQANHPETLHFNQNLLEPDWTEAPEVDIVLASPCCQGHSKARGKNNDNPQHDKSRLTANAVPSLFDYRPPKLLGMVENVPELMKWKLWPAWVNAMELLGFSVSPHIVDCADLGVPQNRVRLFVVLTKSRNPLKVKLPKLDPIPARSFIDFESGRWSKIEKPGRSKATLRRIANGRKQLKTDRFLFPYYSSGSGTTGRSLDRPIGTIRTRAAWGLVDGNRMRMLTREEIRKASSFPDDYILPKSVSASCRLMGNAVPPEAVNIFLTETLKQM